MINFFFIATKISLTKKKKFFLFSWFDQNLKKQGWKKKVKFVWNPRFSGQNPRDTRLGYKIISNRNDSNFFLGKYFGKFFLRKILKKYFSKKNKNFFIIFLIFLPFIHTKILSRYLWTRKWIDMISSS